MTTYWPTQLLSRLLSDTDRSVLAADDGDVTGFTPGKFILATQIGYNGKDTAASAYKLQWRNVTAAGAFADVAATGECKWSATSNVLADGTAVTSTTRRCTADAQETWQNGLENVADNLLPDSGTIDLGSDCFTELQWALDLTDAKANNQYEWRLYNVTQGAALTACAAQITTAIKAHTITDSGSGTDSLKSNKNIVATDTGSGSDSQLTNAQAVIGQTGSGTDLVLLGKSLKLTDSGTGTDGIIKGLAVQVTDTGSGQDQGLRGMAIGITESVSGIDASLIGRPITILDSGSDSEGALIGKVIAWNDMGSGIDLVLSGVSFAIVDSGSGQENINCDKIIALADLVTGTDNAIQAVKGSGEEVIIEDSGIGIDVTASDKNITYSEICSIIDNVIALNTTVHVVEIIDYGYGNDAIKQVKPFCVPFQSLMALDLLGHYDD